MTQLLDTPSGPMTRRQVAKAYGLAYGTIVRRALAGLSGEALVCKPRYDRTYVRQRKSGVYVSPWGLLTHSQLADKIGISVDSFRCRIYTHKWFWHDALNTLPGANRGNRLIMPWRDYLVQFDSVNRLAPDDAIARTLYFMDDAHVEIAHRFRNV